MTVVWTLSEASGHCHVSKRTLMRRIDQLTKHGAYRDDAGVWRVTPDALRAAGFTPGKPSAPDTPRDTASSSADNAELSQLRAELEQWRRRAEIAEAIAAERERVIETQAASLRMLTPSSTAEPARRWWNKLLPA